MQRKTPLKRSLTRLRHRSKKRAAFMRDERVPLTKAMLEESPWCELGPRIRAVVPGYADCRQRAIGLHELKKRGQGGSMLDRENLLRTCGPCNSFVEDRPPEARQAGLVRRWGD